MICERRGRLRASSSGNPRSINTLSLPRTNLTRLVIVSVSYVLRSRLETARSQNRDRQQLAARPIHCIWFPPNRLHEQRLDCAPHGLLEQIRFLGQVDLHCDVCHVPEPLVDLVSRASDEPLEQYGQMPDRRTTLVQGCRKAERVRHHQLAHVLPTDAGQFGHV